MKIEKQARPRHPSTLPLLALAAGLALISASLLGLWWLDRNAPAAATATGPMLGQGKPAHDFSLNDPSGRSVRLSDLRGKVVLVNLWATWCPPCQAEMPDLAAVYQAHSNEGLVILGVDDSELSETVTGFLARNPLPYPVLLDPDSRVARAYGVDYLPVSFLIDRNGILRTTLAGQSSRSRLESAVKPLLAEK